MEKKSKIIIAILTVVVLCLAGFIVYDKTLNSGNKTTVNPDNDQKNENDSKTNTDNCPKCEKCDNNSSNTNNNYGEKVTSLKEITLTTTNQTVTMGSTQYKVRKDANNKLFINDYTNDIFVDHAYVTDKFIFFTVSGQVAEKIVFVQGENGKIGFNNNEYQMHNFKLTDGYIKTSGHIFCGLECDTTDKNLVIKYIDNTLIVIPE